MSDPKQLSYLLKLLDDESSTVRQSILSQLRAFGPDLEPELMRQNIAPSPDELRIMRDVLEEHRRTWLRLRWPSWFEIEDDKEKLEAAMSLIAEFMHGRMYHVSLKRLLDQLTLDYHALYGNGDAKKLARFLFQDYELAGA